MKKFLLAFPAVAAAFASNAIAASHQVEQPLSEPSSNTIPAAAEAQNPLQLTTASGDIFNFVLQSVGGSQTLIAAHQSHSSHESHSSHSSHRSHYSGY